MPQVLTRMNDSQIDTQIAVMQAFRDGKKIRERNRWGSVWITCPHPQWNWVSTVYEVVSGPREFWIHRNCPFNKQVGVDTTVSDNKPWCSVGEIIHVREVIE